MKRKIRSNSMHIFRLHFLHSIRLISVNVRLIRLFSLSLLFVGILFHLLTMITLQILEFNRQKRHLFQFVFIWLLIKLTIFLLYSYLLFLFSEIFVNKMCCCLVNLAVSTHFQILPSSQCRLITEVPYAF